MAKVVLTAVLLLSCAHYPSVLCLSEFTRDDFPADFVFGAATSAFQGDIKLMSDTGLEAYRFSISWPRLLPNGRGPVNPKGLEYYNNVINEIIKFGIQPHVTLHHLDVPQVLQDEYGGWLSPKIIDDFKELADVCFKEFGDRVTHWTTINQPNINSFGSYDYGFFPPCRCSNPYGITFMGDSVNCTKGNSTVEPYITAHNYLLAHSAAVELYRNKYQTIQKGQIGINIYTIGFSPLTNSAEDAMAAGRARDFLIGWFLNPIFFGDYPEMIKTNAGSRLPSFTYSESQKLKGSCDFIGMNYYYSLYVADDSSIPKTGLRDANSDMFAKFTAFKDVPPVSQLRPPTQISHDFESLRKMLNYLKDTYRNPPIYIHENGYGLKFIDSMNDVGRISFLSGFIGSVLQSIRDGIDVRGYFVWTFIDGYELLAGYASRFGFYHVNFEDSEHERTPRLSAHWYRNFLRNGTAIKVQINDNFCSKARSSD
ncbi:beta-glucosidase 22-like isoform X2 [Phalaenopsis equestris]|uniref:beta-glucosidase 22-like isoform X2 n=1 Tax=Phalaenopsis equestris TaxID=78828 RepID=UPI0009E2EDFD|nr:beta-glucosidase 22-like isoform X2 [Phalaenopsis equestris]